MGSWSLLERFIESDHFNNDPSLAVAYLSRYSQHVGIQYVLCSKLRQFAYEEIEFFLPQLCHLLVSVDNESMALEEFIIDLCQESVSGALLTFWLFQTHLYDLSGNPQSNSFRTCRRIFNKVQHIVFGASESIRPEKIQENVLPVTVLASVVLAGVAAPFFPQFAAPLAIAQARKPRPLEETLSEAPPVQTHQRLSRSNTVTGATAKPRRGKARHTRTGSDNAPPQSPITDSNAKVNRKQPLNRRQSGIKNVVRSPNLRPASLAIVDGLDVRAAVLGSNAGEPVSSTAYSSRRESVSPVPGASRSPRPSPSPTPDARKSSSTKPTTSVTLTRQDQIHQLRSNYFRSETQFLTALQDISVRLVSIPKQARLSALRAELALIVRDLPAEVDIPLICPATLEDGIPSLSKHHRVVRLNPAEATSLNSAERVPYLLIVEVLRDDFDFDPDTEVNQQLLQTLASQKPSDRKRLFDISTASKTPVDMNPRSVIDSVFEPANGDLSSADLLRDFEDDEASRADYLSGEKPRSYTPLSQTARMSSGGNTLSSMSIFSTPRTSDIPNSRSSSPGPRKKTPGPNDKTPSAADQPDFSALATHMRTAAQMLAQLDISGAKRPKYEVEAIKAKIIASMQHLEEENFTNDDHTVTFDSIMAKVEEPPSEDGVPSEFGDDGNPTPELAGNTGAGAARMENDQAIGGVRRKGDRDDPSAAMFGEDWKSKKERIRRTSPYGWMKNWDLLSVIVKTGSDLRQEQFACQLIRICGKIWEDAGVPVWVKNMRILVTGESSGLIETITNGVSLHSLKRSLTLASTASGNNPRKRFATLKDHFVKTFGEVDSDGYRAAEDAFMRSLAAYSMLSYILQLKDRHNGNILIDNQGHIIHIDFGFMLSNSPGSVGFEAAPFKLTSDYVDVLGGVGAPGWDAFKLLCKQAFQALRKSAENIIMVVEMMSKESKMACFVGGGQQTTSMLRQRFQLHLSKEEAEAFVETDLIGKSIGSYYTRLYDTFQYRTQGIY